MSNGFNPANFDPHDPAFLKDPYPTYALFREKWPIYTVEPYKASWIFRYEDCKEVLDDKDIWVKNLPGGSKPPYAYGPYGMMAFFPEGMFSSDPPRHEKLRALVEPLFMGAIKTAPPYAAGVASALLTTARAQGRMELVTDYALPLPARVLFNLLGIPNDADYPGVWEVLIAWQAEIAAAHDITQSPMVRGLGASFSMALNSFFEGMLLGEPAKAGLFPELCKAFQGPGWSSEDAQICASDFVVAGYLSTTFIIGTGTRNLLEHPEQLEALRANPELIHQALEEMMRFDGPVHIVDRIAAVDTKLGEHEFKAGDKVSAVIGSANRDPNAFKEPDAFDIERLPLKEAEAAQLGFGNGIHYCIGAPLVRLVAPVAFEELLNTFPGLALDGEPQWQTDPYLRAVTNLPLRF
jgi:cytochrome P450